MNDKDSEDDKSGSDSESNFDEEGFQSIKGSVKGVEDDQDPQSTDPLFGTALGDSNAKIEKNLTIIKDLKVKR